jgi:exo-beta-1,3-glucanase (GH17 family)
MKTKIILWISFFLLACNSGTPENNVGKTAGELLGKPEYPAICYGGYREKTREVQPTVEQIKEDMVLLHTLGFRFVRTYHTKRPHAENVLKAIKELKSANDSFEMYVMLGAWIQCKGAFTDNPDHTVEDSLENEGEVTRAIKLARTYPDIVKVLAVGNESMVHWAATYYVHPRVVLRWVNYVQDLKEKGELPKALWVTSSDNFASWGGGSDDYHNEELNDLIKAVDYVSMHTYPMHDTHYNPDFWGLLPEDTTLSREEQIERAMNRALNYSASQVQSTEKYVHSIASEKPVHIGETGWASMSNGHYGPEGSKACDEYKESLYFDLISNWSLKNGKTCFYFEGFDEIWKDAANPGGSENHFGLFTIDGKAKYVLWDEIDAGILEGLSRDGNPINKTYQGSLDSLMKDVLLPPVMKSKSAP